MLLTTKYLIFQTEQWRMENLTEKFIRCHRIKTIVLTNIVKLESLIMVKIHPVVNISMLVLYKKQVKE